MALRDWQHVETLFHKAIRLEGGERDAYLDEECAGDDPLRAEVESLIAALNEREGFMEEPAFTLGMRLLSGDEGQSLTGTTIGSYKILRALGRGGMGEVYL